MTDTTQTQVTGPVDDAIDAELAELTSLSHVTNTWEHKRDRLVRSLNARLAPRAPMPDVVTVPVNPIWLLCSISYLNDLSERGIGTDAKDIVMIRQIIAEFRAALEATDVE